MSDEAREPRERKERPNIDHMFTLKVDNITYRATPDILKEKFNAYGEVGDVYIPRVPGSSDPRGFAFIRFLNKKDADDALQALDNTEIDGRVIRIQEAKEKRPDHSNNNRNNRGGFRDRDERRDGGFRRDRSRDRGSDRGSDRGGDYRRGGDRDYRGGGDRDFRGGGGGGGGGDRNGPSRRGRSRSGDRGADRRDNRFERDDRGRDREGDRDRRSKSRSRSRGDR